MASRYFTIVFAVLCIFQLFQLYGAARLVPRSADEGNASPATPDVLTKAGEAISNTLTSWREGIQNLVKGAPSIDDVVSGVSTNLQKLSSGVQDFSKKVVSSINPDSTAPST